MARKPVDPEEELRWMAQEVRGYVEAVLNSLAANVPKVFYLLFQISFIFLKTFIYICISSGYAGCCSLSSGKS